MSVIRYAWSLIRYALNDFVVYNYFLRALRFRSLARRFPTKKPPFDEKTILAELADRGIHVELCEKTLNDFTSRVRGTSLPLAYRLNMMLASISTPDFHVQKRFQIFTALEEVLARHNPTVLDVGASFLSLGQLTGSHPGTYYVLDKKYAPGIEGQRIGASADNIPLPDDSVDVICLLSAFEHFEDDADRGAFTEFLRILRPGGVLGIIPLHLANEDFLLIQPLMARGREILQQCVARNERIVLRNEFNGFETRFARYYSPQTLCDRFPSLLECSHTIKWNAPYGFFYLTLKASILLPAEKNDLEQPA